MIITSGDHTPRHFQWHHWIGITSSADRIATGSEVRFVVIHFRLSKLNTSKIITSKSVRHPRFRMTPILTPSCSSEHTISYLFSYIYNLPLGCSASTKINTTELLLLSLFVFIIAFVQGTVYIATCYGLDGRGVESKWSRQYPHPSRSALWPTQLPI